ncbi:MAG TPA: squalene synthase HpnC [Gammaproteobacteria bacterium]|nr:squalene synthase HpnC [Gammaproteobacteria bacterium]
MSTSPPGAQEGYRWCRALARSHYENFPVASRLLPARLRDPVAAIYAFARTADDIADEGDTGAGERLQQLDDMARKLDAISTGHVPDIPLYQALADSIGRHRLPFEPFHDLLDAFRQDVNQQRYADFGELMNYCRRSANPVGRLLLHLNGQATERNLALSDAVCSALQLINFLQDIDADYRAHGRIYIPQDEMQRFDVTEDDIAQRRNSFQFRLLIRHQVDRAEKLLRAGSPLGMRLGGRFGLELRAIILGGARVLEKLRRQDDMFSRPQLTGSDRRRILLGALKQGFVRLSPARRLP